MALNIVEMSDVIQLKHHGCEFCNDLRNIEPAKYIGCSDKNLQEFIKEAEKEKKFIYHFKDENEAYLAVVNKCPKCGYEFTEDDYDSYIWKEEIMNFVKVEMIVALEDKNDIDVIKKWETHIDHAIDMDEYPEINHIEGVKVTPLPDKNNVKFSIFNIIYTEPTGENKNVKYCCVDRSQAHRKFLQEHTNGETIVRIVSEEVGSNDTELTDYNHLKSRNKKSCLMCKKNTDRLDIMSEAYFCSTKCEEEFYEKVNRLENM